MISIKAEKGNPRTVRFYDEEGKSLKFYPKSLDIRLRPNENITAIMEFDVGNLDLEILLEGVTVNVDNKNNS